MRFGISILADEPWQTARGKWERVDELGFDHGWVFDHLVWGGLPDGRWYSSVPIMSAVAALTPITIGSFVATPNFRHPAAFAREVQTMVDISDGRILLGLGAGGTPDDGILGQEPLSARQKVDRFVEFTDLLDRMLDEDRVTADGDYFQVRNMRLVGGSVRARVPMILAGNGPRSIRFAAARGDAWMTTGLRVETLDEWFSGLAESSARFEDALTDNGRDPSTVDRYLNLDASPQFSLESVGVFDEMVGRSAELGFTDVITHWPRSSAPFRGTLDVLESLATRGLAAH